MAQPELDFNAPPPADHIADVSKMVDDLAGSDAVKQLHEHLATNADARAHLKQCPLCNANIKDRKAALFTSLIGALYEVYKWCGEHKCHEFTTKDIRHLLDRNCYARFGDLVRFGGVVYRPDKKAKARFGINMARAREFFGGVYKIPVQIHINQVTNEIIESRYVSVTDFPTLKQLLDDGGLYDHTKNLCQ